MKQLMMVVFVVLALCPALAIAQQEAEVTQKEAKQYADAMRPKVAKRLYDTALKYQCLAADDLKKIDEWLAKEEYNAVLILTLQKIAPEHKRLIEAGSSSDASNELDDSITLFTTIRTLTEYPGGSREKYSFLKGYLESLLGREYK